jgi:RNA polymerase sigma-70 factor (ECF subfamily)
MHELVGRLASSVVDVDQELEREFEARLVESSTLAFRVAYSVLRQREDAEDVAQEAFAKAYRSFHQLRDRDRFRAWLVRMTWRLAIDRRRGDHRREARESAHAATAPLVDAESVDESFRARELWRAIDALPDNLRIAIVLASIEGHDLADVASLLRLPVGTVKSRLFLARRRLKEQLQWIR